MSSLSGALADFAIHEVLGLVARKPGQWLVQLEGEHTGFVALRDGSVVGCSADTSRQCLARRFVLEGAVGTTALAQALRASGAGGVVQELVRAHAIDPEAITPLTRQHIVGVLAEVSRWRQGTFTADRATTLPDDVGVGFTLPELGVEVGALLKRWREATELLGGPDVVLTGHPGPVPAHLRGLHSLVDGRRSVAELAEASGHGTVGTMVDAADLARAGCVVPLVAGSGGLEQRLTMLSTVETAQPPQSARPQAPQLAVIPGGASAEEEEVRTAAAGTDSDEDLLGVILRGVRGV